MPKIKIFSAFLVLINLLLISSICNAQHDREAYAAGKFYPADPRQLRSQLHELFSTTTQIADNEVLAIISPHAGFVYSGKTAAIAYSQIPPDKQFENIFIIGSSHTMAINGASIYSAGDYITPLGKVKVNRDLAQKLIEENQYFSFIPVAHLSEHILENQMPFLQYHLEKDFKIVPISIGTENGQILKSIAKTLEPYLNRKNLFIISADFSHYPAYRDAQKADSLTASAIISNDFKRFKDALKQNQSIGYPGLVTSTCGSSAIKTLLNITALKDDFRIIPLSYQNSGDASLGDKNRVVGYFSLALVTDQKSSSNFLSHRDKKDLLRIARLTLDEYINKGRIPDIDPKQFSENLMQQLGAFVTLNKNDKLRGCLGIFVTEKPLYLTVQEMAIASATNDYRFPEVLSSELGLIDIEISVLTPLKKIQSPEQIELGRDGIYIIKGSKSGTFLPKVATDTGWTIEEFLGHCARDKAGIGWDGWKTAEIFTFQALVFEE